MAAASVLGLARRYVVPEIRTYRWKSRFGGTEVSDVKRRRELKQDYRRLKKLQAYSDFDKAALKDPVEESW